MLGVRRGEGSHTPPSKQVEVGVGGVGGHRDKRAWCGTTSEEGAAKTSTSSLASAAPEEPRPPTVAVASLVVVVRDLAGFKMAEDPELGAPRRGS